MRYIIYIVAFLFCGNAMAQVSIFGNNNPNGFAKTVNTLWLSKYADGDSVGNVLAVDVEGKVYKTNGGSTIDTTRYILYTDTSRSGIVATYFYVDSLYNTIGTHDSLVKYSDSLTNIYVTGYRLDTAKTNLRTSIATKLNAADTASLSTRINAKLTKGGDATGANLSAGTNDAFRFDLEANNANAISIHNGGNVSVGSTTNAGYKFDVTGNIHVSNEAYIGTTASNGLQTALTVAHPNNVALNGVAAKYYPRGTGNASVTEFGVHNGGGAIDSAYFKVNNTYRFIMTANQNIYMNDSVNVAGTVSARRTLTNDVEANAIHVGSFTRYHTAKMKVSATADSNKLSWYMHDGVGAGTQVLGMTQTGSGRVGINTTLPTSRLDINAANGYQQLRLRTTYTPTSSADANGAIGDTAWDDNYFYLKTSAGWKRTALTAF